MGDPGGGWDRRSAQEVEGRSRLALAGKRVNPQNLHQGV